MVNHFITNKFLYLSHTTKGSSSIRDAMPVDYNSKTLIWLINALELILWYVSLTSLYFDLRYWQYHKSLNGNYNGN